MRKVVLYHLQSFDGIAHEDGEWFTDTGPEMIANLGRVIASQEDVLLGRRTYDDWAALWPGADFEPFASFINGTEKHVVTSSTPAQRWENSTVVSTSVVDYVAELRRQTGGEIGIHGSIDLARSLLTARLVDELELVVASIAVGAGRRVLDETTAQPLELLDSRRSPQGTLFLTYRCPDART